MSKTSYILNFVSKMSRFTRLTAKIEKMGILLVKKIWQIPCLRTGDKPGQCGNVKKRLRRSEHRFPFSVFWVLVSSDVKTFSLC